MPIREAYAESYSGRAVGEGGMSTAEQGQPNNTTAATATSTVVSNGSQNVMGAWLLVAAVLVGLTLLAEKFSVGQTYGQVKIGFYNMVVITLYVVLGLSLGKVFFTKVKVPGLSVLFTAV